MENKQASRGKIQVNAGEYSWARDKTIKKYHSMENLKYSIIYLEYYKK